VARTAVPVQVTARTGVLFAASGSEVAGDIVNGHEFVNDGATYLYARNVDVVNPASITVLVGRTVDGQTVASKVLSVTTNGQRLFGPWPVDVYNQPTAPTKVYFDVGDVDLRLSIWKLGG